MKYNRNTTFFAKVLDTQRLLYEGEVVSLSSYNDKGPFDILADHINFISLIKQKITLHESSGKSTEISIDRGILRVYGGKADVFLATAA